MSIGRVFTKSIQWGKGGLLKIYKDIYWKYGIWKWERWIEKVATSSWTFHSHRRLCAHDVPCQLKYTIQVAHFESDSTNLPTNIRPASSDLCFKCATYCEPHSLKITWRTHPNFKFQICRLQILELVKTWTLILKTTWNEGARGGNITHATMC